MKKVPKARAQLEPRYWERRRVCLELTNQRLPATTPEILGLFQLSDKNRYETLWTLLGSEFDSYAGDLREKDAIESLRASRPDCMEMGVLSSRNPVLIVGHLSKAKTSFRVRAFFAKTKPATCALEFLACLEACAIWTGASGGSSMTLPRLEPGLKSVIEINKSNFDAAADEAVVYIKTDETRAPEAASFWDSPVSKPFRIAAMKVLPVFLKGDST
ncbi:hypothetical protein [Variovorax sp. KK3]|uniref:hypothetical protein n=1 Tax=Variovorax sp. KK3 TaxID=1855728 RepID=UPI00117E41A1|nr:hypothetical protein [Variovorax sp. KK3]